MRSHLALALVLLATAGCSRDLPRTVFMPDMAYSPAFKAQEEGSMRLPVKGTVSRNQAKAYEYPKDPEASASLRNPLKPTRDVLKRGQTMFNTYCIVCHGPMGEGNGTIVPKFPRPPSLQSDKVKGFADGRFYHIMTMGQNLMPGYASQISREDRWAIAHYIRVLHRAKSPTAEDLRAAEGK